MKFYIFLNKFGLTAKEAAGRDIIKLEIMVKKKMDRRCQSIRQRVRGDKMQNKFHRNLYCCLNVSSFILETVCHKCTGCSCHQGHRTLAWLK